MKLSKAVDRPVIYIVHLTKEDFWFALYKTKAFEALNKRWIDTNRKQTHTMDLFAILTTSVSQWEIWNRSFEQNLSYFFCIWPLPATVIGADINCVWNNGASADTSHWNCPDISGPTESSVTLCAFDTDTWNKRWAFVCVYLNAFIRSLTSTRSPCIINTRVGGSSFGT